MAHSRHGMSGQSRIIACPGSIPMTDGCEDETNKQAELGTAVHEICEWSLHLGVQPHYFIGFVFKGFKCTDEMADSAKIYVDAINQFKPLGVKLIVEGKVCITSIDKERLWGTGDAIAIDYNNRKLYIGDYKNGYGIVEVDPVQKVYGSEDINGNAQCVGYGLGALDTYGLWDKVDEVITFVVQPNVDHVDGPIRYKSYTMPEMMKWHGVYKHTHALSLLPDAPRQSGKHCTYCLAKGFCGTRISDMMTSLKLDSSVINLNDDQMLGVYKQVSSFKKALEAIQSEVLKRARKGMNVPGEKLVKSIVRAKCVDEETLVNEAVENHGVDVNDLYTKKLKSKTDIRKLVGGALVNRCYVTPVAGQSLVPLSNPRAAVRADKIPDASGVFSEIKQG